MNKRTASALLPSKAKPQIGHAIDHIEVEFLSCLAQQTGRHVIVLLAKELVLRFVDDNTFTLGVYIGQCKHAIELLPAKQQQLLRYALAICWMGIRCKDVIFKPGQ